MRSSSHMILLRKHRTGMRKCGSPCGKGVSIPSAAISYRDHYTRSPRNSRKEEYLPSQALKTLTSVRCRVGARAAAYSHRRMRNRFARLSSFPRCKRTRRLLTQNKACVISLGCIASWCLCLDES